MLPFEIVSARTALLCCLAAVAGCSQVLGLDLDGYSASAESDSGVAGEHAGGGPSESGVDGSLEAAEAADADPDVDAAIDAATESEADAPAKDVVAEALPESGHDGADVTYDATPDVHEAAVSADAVSDVATEAGCEPGTCAPPGYSGFHCGTHKLCGALPGSAPADCGTCPEVCDGRDCRKFSDFCVPLDVDNPSRAVGVALKTGTVACPSTLNCDAATWITDRCVFTGGPPVNVVPTYWCDTVELSGEFTCQ